MGGNCFNLSLVELKLRMLRHHYRSCGLQSELIEIDDGTIVHCWVPTPPRPEKGVWSVPTADKPALLFIHGFSANGTIGWEHQIGAFVKKFHVYVPDLIFFGESTSKSKQRSESFQAKCLVKMLQLLGVQNEVNVVGTSYGGMVAFRMAHLYPKFVNKIVFSDSGVCMVPTTNDALLAKCHYSHISEILLPTTVQGLRTALSVAVYRTIRLPDFIYQDMLDVLCENNRQEKLELLDGLVIGTEQAFPLPKLTQEKMLIVWGEHDEIFNLDLAFNLQKHLGPAAELVVMKKCGHCPQLETPKAYNQIVFSFLEST